MNDAMLLVPHCTAALHPSFRTAFSGLRDRSHSRSRKYDHSIKETRTD